MEKMESIDDAITEMRRLKSKLPPRPSPEDVNRAIQMIERVDNKLTAQLGELALQTKPQRVPYHVFRAYLSMREDLLRSEAQEEKRMALGVKEVEDRHQLFDSLIQVAESAAVHPLGNIAVQDGSAYDYKQQPGPTTPDGSKHKNLPPLSEDTSYAVPPARASSIGRVGSHSFKGSTSALKPSAPTASFAALSLDSVANRKSRTSTQEASTPGPQPGDEENVISLYSPQLLQAIERARIDNLEELSLSNMNLKVIPELIGTLTNLTSLNLSGNHLKALPESICELTRLTDLIIDHNELKVLPDSIGCLTDLKHLILEHNKLDELPVVIGRCTGLVEMDVGFNELKVLPEATGNLTSLQKLNIHMNHVQYLPATLYNLTNLVELRISFNEIKRIPDGVCRFPKLTKLDASGNFTDLRELPKDIGDIQSLRELNIASNQISMLPPSFARLTGLEKLEMDQNPWVIPPLDVVGRGKEAVLQFMMDLETTQRTDEKEGVKKTGFGTRLSSVFRKKSPSTPYKVKPVNPLQTKA